MSSMHPIPHIYVINQPNTPTLPPQASIISDGLLPKLQKCPIIPRMPFKRRHPLHLRSLRRIPAASPAMDAEAEHHPTDVFVLAGQSNMSGRGGVRHRRWDGAVPPECRPRPAVLRFSARSLWVEAHEPLHADIDAAKTCGVGPGPGMPFADAVLPRLPPGAAVGLVPCAVGGTAIGEWERGARLYEQMVRRAKEAVGGGGVLRAVLWYQGESDTASQHAAEAYGANMERLIRDLRADLGLPSLPFIQVALASGDGAFAEKVRRAQLGLDLPNVVCVDAKGLPLNEDHLHLSTEAQVRLGCMLAEAYVKNFLASGDTPPAPPLPACP